MPDVNTRSTSRRRNQTTNSGINKSIFGSRRIKADDQKIDDLLNQAALNLYGTDLNDTGNNDLANRFNKILSTGIEQLTNADEGDISSFLSQVVSMDKKTNAANELLNNQFMSMTGDEYSTMQSFIYDAYRNQLLEQSDLHEVAGQLIELSEAILVTRDAIVSADVVEGRMSRTIEFENVSDEENESSISIVESVEKKFKLLEKIKNFIIPKALEYGTYYSYVIPYSKLFNDYMVAKTKEYGYGHHMYGESVTIMESFDEGMQGNDKSKHSKEFEDFITEAYDDYVDASGKKTTKARFVEENADRPLISKEEFKKDLQNMLGNISICNDPVPLPIMEEGVESIKAFKESFVSESGDQLRYDMLDNNSAMYFQYRDNGLMTEEIHEPMVPNDLFNALSDNKLSADGGVSIQNGKSSKKKGQFDDVRDCYIKMMDPMRIIPIKIMDTKIGYYYVVAEDITPLDGGVSSTLYYNKFDEHRRESTVVDAIARQVVRNFDKKFLVNNSKFKKVIVDCINYYNLNEKRLKFQFIPVEYMEEFSIDEDVDGNGQSMIKKSLFYAKLYLMLLLFKIMTIIINSNDMKVNYLKNSGIDKNLANKVQEIARQRQNRQINMTDLFSYTSLINKVGNGAEMYIPVGRSGERPIETEILQGQDVQLNTELMEMLKNAYILGTGCPAAILNYLNEADFAKQIEQNNTKYNGRVVNYQLDFNPHITSWYRKILRSSTNLSEAAIRSFKFTLQPPKTTSTTAKTEAMDQTQRYQDFLVNMVYGDVSQSMDETLQEEVRQFRALVAEDQLPMIDKEQIQKWRDEAKILAMKARLQPKPENGDSGMDSYDDIMGQDMNAV